MFLKQCTRGGLSQRLVPAVTLCLMWSDLSSNKIDRQRSQQLIHVIIYVPSRKWNALYANIAQTKTRIPMSSGQACHGVGGSTTCNKLRKYLRCSCWGLQAERRVECKFLNSYQPVDLSFRSLFVGLLNTTIKRGEKKMLTESNIPLRKLSEFTG